MFLVLDKSIDRIFFFFQAEDGIRDLTVTGVQTCALPILEARLVKDIQPRFNVELKDDKTFPYLQIRVREDFPRVEFTRKPRRRGVKLYEIGRASCRERV